MDLEDALVMEKSEVRIKAMVLHKIEKENIAQLLIPFLIAIYTLRSISNKGLSMKREYESCLHCCLHDHSSYSGSFLA